ncbi:glutaminase A L-glutamine amidohydrolase [Lineolata rhizophorae]|uniref:Glutaminase A L-glutamine amidohydrolase n=1 Tax=Lineolata rhizophorae TaxID=578093 RepID=A0A6A6NVR8_9PEZI|nr:glutaminase A L-glutamine amidohydrolase [Lineolata rhizophorae]
MRLSDSSAVLAGLATMLLASTARAALTPPVLPLFVRTPYLSTWMGDARNMPWEKWPMFYTGQEIGFGVLASVPETGNVYPLLGRPHDSLSKHGDGYNVSLPLYKGQSYDASTTNLTYEIPSPSYSGEPLEIVLSFLSPVTPTSTLRQSIPAGYMTVYVQGDFDLDIYVDVNGLWVSGNRGSRIVWDLVDNTINPVMPLKTWSVRRETEALFTEFMDRAEWGTLHFSAPATVRHESGTSAVLRQRFSRTGTLQNEIDDSYRGIMDSEPVFAFSTSFSLGNSSSSDTSSTSKRHRRHDSVTFTIAHTQDPVTQFASARGLTLMRPLWKSYFLTEEALLAYHYADFHNAVRLAEDYSRRLALDAYVSGAQDYADIVSLSARQVLGATSFSGTPDAPILFLKEISSNGNCQTVDVIFPAFPFFLYTNPRWLAYLMDPLVEHMLSGQYPNDYSMHDLGTHFPNMTGHPDGHDEYMPVEECGDMLIMVLALANSLAYDKPADAVAQFVTEGDNLFDASMPGSGAGDGENSVFPLTALETRAGVDNLDGRWGGHAQGHKQAVKWVAKSYRLLKQWTGYLVDFSLEPHNQLSTDDFAGWLALQTNLALKGIVGIKAMSELASLVGEARDATFYANVSETYIEKWQGFGMARDGGRAKLAYDWFGSWTTLYSLFADAVLCFHPSIYANESGATDGGRPVAPEPEPAPGRDDQEPLFGGHSELRKRSEADGASPFSKKNATTGDFIPHAIYETQSSWYGTALQKYGLPLDSRHLYTKSDWEFEAAAVAARPVRAEILTRVARWLNETVTDRPFTDLYNTEGKGGFPGPNFFARPVVGAHFAFLALERSCLGKGMGAEGGEE